MAAGLQDVRTALAGSDIALLSLDDIADPAVAVVVLAILRAFPLPSGKSQKAGRLLLEAKLAHQLAGRADLVLAHPDTGVVVIEVKGLQPDQVARVMNGTIYTRSCSYKETSPLKQAERTMFRLRAEFEIHLASGRESLPTLTAMVAFPHLDEDACTEKLLRGGFSRDEVLVAEDFERPSRVRESLARRALSFRPSVACGHMLRDEAMTVFRSLFGDTAVLADGREPTSAPDGSIGEEINRLSSREKNLTDEQQELSRAKFLGRPNVVRGVAGSGKTIVLANNVAQLMYRTHRETEGQLPGLDHPAFGGKAAVICFNNALVPFIQDKLDRAYAAIPMADPPRGALFVDVLNGLMSRVVDESGGKLKYIPVNAETGVTDREARASMYRAQLADLGRKTSAVLDRLLFDCIYIDEGQDFYLEEYRLLLDLIRPHPSTDEKSVVIFYDDAQNVYGLPRYTWTDVPIEVVGRSHVMSKCHRNTREIIALAFNVLLGCFSPPSVKVRTRTFADVADLLDRGLISQMGDDASGPFAIHFAEDEGGPIPKVNGFRTRSEELLSVAQEIRRLLYEERVQPTDVLVVSCDRSVLNETRKVLQAELPDMPVRLASESRDEKRRPLFRPGYLSLSTVQSAKGHDAWVVFLIATDVLQEKRLSETERRARFYVGSTRARRWLYVSGVELGDGLIAEVRRASAGIFEKR